MQLTISPNTHLLFIRYLFCTVIKKISTKNSSILVISTKGRMKTNFFLLEFVSSSSQVQIVQVA